MRLEDSKFDVLLRKAAQQTTRREALGALIGGALLLNIPDASEATKEAKRRKHDHHHELGASTYRSIGIDIDNSASTKPVIVNSGQAGFSSCCKYRFDGTVPAGVSRTLIRTRPRDGSLSTVGFGFSSRIRRFCHRTLMSPCMASSPDAPPSAVMSFRTGLRLSKMQPLL